MKLLDLHGLWAASDSFSPRTVEARRSLVNILEAGGFVTTHDLAPEAVAGFFAARLKVVSVATVNQNLVSLAPLLEIAVKRRLLPKKLLAYIRGLKVKAKRQRQLTARFLSKEEYARLVAAADARCDSDARRADADSGFMIRVAVMSGMRMTELRRLEWEDVLRDRRVIHVQAKPHLGARDGRMKNGRERLVSISTELLALLDAKRPANATGFLFPRKDGSLQNAKNFCSKLERARADAGLPDVTFHVLRHTRASWLIQGGCPIAKVARDLGHTVQTCLMHYVGLSDGYDPDLERAA